MGQNPGTIRHPNSKWMFISLIVMGVDESSPIFISYHDGDVTAAIYSDLLLVPKPQINQQGCVLFPNVFNQNL
jgi:hypothetical protein